jgi:hypothetical protein
MVSRTGQYAHVNPRHPQAMGICDRTGFLFNRKDLVKQMVWAGNKLVWTGFWVGRPFVDMPNEQSRPSILGPDPVPVPFPRPALTLLTPWEVMDNLSWEFQGFPWEEQEESPSPEIVETITGWGAPSNARQALPGKEREALLQGVYFGSFEGT